MDLNKTIQLIKSKDRKAEKAFFCYFAPYVLTQCRRYVSKYSEAEDFMQECFIHVFDKIHMYDASKGDFKPWLKTVCTNKILKLLRNNKREVVIVYPEVLPEKELTQEEFVSIPREDIIAAIQQLPYGYKEVFNLYMFEGWSHKEIAETLNISDSTSRSQLTRAKKLLKLFLLKKRHHKYERKLA